MKIQGLLFIIVASLLPWIWYGPLATQGGGAAAFSQFAGAVSLILMGITQLMATRIKGVEALFGSMDRIYVLHKWLAIFALGAAFLHANIDAELGNIVLNGRLEDNAEDIGDLAYNGFIFLTVTSLITIIPYKFWKWSHRLIGLFFALAAYHYIYVAKPFAVFDIPGLYIGAFCLMGIASYLYLLLPRLFGHNSVKYKVDSVIQHKSATEINLKPEGRGITHKAGQFAFINFNPLLLQEVHPFTISSAPQPDGNLRFMVKGLGSYTKRLTKMLEAGSTARVSSPFGHFSLRPTKGPQVWIGGGIGITPFMAWAQALPAEWPSPTRLYYCVPTAADALRVEEFEGAAKRVENFDFSLAASREGKRLTAQQIVDELEGDIGEAHVYFCGPTGMRDVLKQGLVNHGLRPSQFHYEEFEMRSSIGVVRFFRRIWTYFTS